MEPAPNDLRRAIEFLQEIQPFRDARALTHHVVGSLTRLVEGESVALTEVNLLDGDTRWVGHPPDRLPERVIGPQVREIARSCVAHHPTVRWYRRTRSGRAIRMSDTVSRPALRGLRVYREFYRPLGIQDQLSIRFPRPRHLMASLAVGRAGWGFSERERAVMDLVRPHLVAAFDNAKSWERLRERGTLLEDALAASDIVVVPLTTDGRVEDISPAAAAWLREFFPASPARSRLPEELRLWLARERAETRRGLVPAARPYRAERNGARLVVRTLKTAGRSALLIERHAPHLDPAALPGLGLTPREADVLSLVAHDAPHQAIARSLGVSARTVDKHLEHIYRKLGVRGRFEAVARSRELGAGGQAGSRAERYAPGDRDG
jgi:DNA-binding CsgD family transcriptional regulator